MEAGVSVGEGQGGRLRDLKEGRGLEDLAVGNIDFY